MAIERFGYSCAATLCAEDHVWQCAGANTRHMNLIVPKFGLCLPSLCARLTILQATDVRQGCRASRVRLVAMVNCNPRTRLPWLCKLILFCGTCSTSDSRARCNSTTMRRTSMVAVSLSRAVMSRKQDNARFSASPYLSYITLKFGIEANFAAVALSVFVYYVQRQVGDKSCTWLYGAGRWG